MSRIETLNFSGSKFHSCRIPEIAAIAGVRGDCLDLRRCLFLERHIPFISNRLQIRYKNITSFTVIASGSDPSYILLRRFVWAVETK